MYTDEYMYFIRVYICLLHSEANDKRLCVRLCDYITCVCVYTPACILMGWLRLVGSLKLYVSYAEHSLFYRALLRKRPTFLRSLPIEATPHECMSRTHECVQFLHSEAHAKGLCVDACDCVTCSCVYTPACILMYACLYTCTCAVFAFGGQREGAVCSPV